MEKDGWASDEYRADLSFAEANVPAEWKVGDQILDLYEVKQICQGGMGFVYRVKHKGWNVDLAVKSPRAEHFQTEQQKQEFIHECQAWIELGLHPHIVSCYYVRTLGGIPRIFAEYVEGGSLSDWIRNRKLYEGEPQQVLKRILDIAIQMAWGLHYAHEKGLIHQDVKPANMMMTPDGSVKVTDFGLARAREATGATTQSSESRRSIVVPGAGLMTKEYASPEQAAGQPLTRRSDIWSWAVTVLEMFAGELRWQYGPAALAVLADYDELMKNSDAAIPMPKDVHDYLTRCLAKQQEDRPHDCLVVAEALQTVFNNLFDEPYPRLLPTEQELDAGTLNNQAVSMLDLGREETATQLFEAALKADPLHPEATYNQGLALWRNGLITDLQLVSRLEEVRKNLATHPLEEADTFHQYSIFPEEGEETSSSSTGEGRDESEWLRNNNEDGWVVDYLLGLVHIERGDAEVAWEKLTEAAKYAPMDMDVQNALEIACTGCNNWFRSFEQYSGDPYFGLLMPDEWMRHLRCFEGHTDLVESIAITPDGRFGLSGSVDGTLRLWNLATGTCLQKVEGNIDVAFGPAVAITADGRIGLSGSDDGTVFLWDLMTGKCLWDFKGHTGNIHSVSMTPDGRFGLSGSADKTLRYWDFTNKKCLRTFAGSTSSVAITFDGRIGLSGIQLWDLATGSCLRSFDWHTDTFWSVAMTPDGRFGLSGSVGGTLRLLDLTTGKCLRSFEGHTDNIQSVALTSDGRIGISGSDDGTLRLWDLTTGMCLRSVEGYVDGVLSVALTPDGRFGISGSDNTLQSWSILTNPRKCSVALTKPRGTGEMSLAYVAFRKTCKQIVEAMASEDYSRALIEVKGGRSELGFARNRALLDFHHSIGSKGKRVSLRGAWVKRVFNGHTDEIHSVALAPNGRIGLSGSNDNTLRLWDLATGECLRTFAGHTEDVFSVALSPDGRFGLSGSADRSLRLWDLMTGKCLRDYKGHTGIVHSVSMTPDSRFGLSGSSDKTLRLWDLATGKTLRTFEGHANWITSAAITSDGRFGFSGSLDETLRFWNIATGKCLRSFKGYGRYIPSVAIASDGKFGLSGSTDGQLRFWDLASGKCLRSYRGHTGDVCSVTLTSDCRFGFSGGVDRTLRLWDLATGECLRTFAGHTEDVFSVALSPDGRFGLSGSLDKTLRLWEFDWEYEIPAAADWDEGARPYLESFLRLQIPYAAELPRDREPSEAEITVALTRRGKPEWSEADFKQLLTTLGHVGYGWLRPAGVRRELEKMTRDWTACQR